METARSPITCEIDFKADGKQAGFLRLPHSVHRSAYGWIPIPIAQVKNGEGPTFLLMSGNHGDEFEGQVTLTKLLQMLEPDMVQGRIIILPMANYPAALAGMRTSPIDEGNLNRSFPGDPRGSVTEIIAHFIESVLMKMADYSIDLHSGGSSLHYLPTVLFGKREDPDDNRAILDLMRAFGAPYACNMGGGGTGNPGVSSAAARRQGVRSIMVEIGGAGTVSPADLAIMEEGVRRILLHTGVLKGELGPSPRETRTLGVTSAKCFVYARDEGLFEPALDLGAEVEAGDLAGTVHFPETPWKASVPIQFETGGIVICKRVPGRVQRGDCLFHLGKDVDV